MMETLLTTLVNLILLALLWWMYFFCFRQYRHDKTRQEFFAIRDRLFTEAQEAGLSFDAEAYKITRQLLNRMIRFTHRLSVIQVISILIAQESEHGRSITKEFEEKLERALSELNFHERKMIMRARKEMHEVVVNHILFNSIFFFSLVVLVSVAMLSRNLLKQIVHGKKTRLHWAAIDAGVRSAETDDLAFAN